jgi:hypothetical protein
MFLINGGEYWQAKEVKNKGNQRGVHRETEGQNLGKRSWLYHRVHRGRDEIGAWLSHRVHRGRDEIGGVYLPSQLQLTLQLPGQISLAKPANLNFFKTSTSEILFFLLFILPPEQY